MADGASFDPVINLKELAPIFRRTPDTFTRIWKSWVEKRGFPPPLPGRKPLLWSRQQVLAWIKNTSMPVNRYAALLPANDTADPAVEDGRRRLEARYRHG